MEWNDSSLTLVLKNWRLEKMQVYVLKAIGIILNVANNPAWSKNQQRSNC